MASLESNPPAPLSPPDLIRPVELRLRVDDRGRVLVQRGEQVRQAGRFPAGRLLHRAGTILPDAERHDHTIPRKHRPSIIDEATKHPLDSLPELVHCADAMLRGNWKAGGRRGDRRIGGILMQCSVRALDRSRAVRTQSQLGWMEEEEAILRLLFASKYAPLLKSSLLSKSARAVLLLLFLGLLLQRL